MNGSRVRTVRRPPIPLAAVLCAAALLAGCSDGGAGGTGGPRKSSPAAKATTASVSNDLEADYQGVVEDVLPSVVQITTGKDLGSGIVYDTEGHVVTNAHVVGDARTFDVALVTGEETVKAELVSSYPESDLAVIKLSEVPDQLTPAKFGDSAKVEMGQIVMAMGNPLGLSGSVTQGIVSGLGRTVSEGRTGGGTGATIPNMVQTSAAINPGNSGGALVNLDSEVIGIPTLAATDGDDGAQAPGIGFAIPASTVTGIADQIIEKGEVTESGRAAIGITGRTVLGDDLEPAGVAVVTVVPDGAADKAGIREGDVITRFADRRIRSMDELAEALASDTPGDKVEITYDRDGTTRTAEVTLGEL